MGKLDRQSAIFRSSYIGFKLQMPQIVFGQNVPDVEIQSI
jgi:hypothetical protein